MLTREEIGRYARQLVLPEVGVDGQQRLAAARVLVVGAGGLGTPALLYLAGAGVGTIHLIDHDEVDVSNLHRQVIHGTSAVGSGKAESAARRLRELNSHVTVVRDARRLEAAIARDLVREYDLVVDGSDNFPTRYLVNDACVMERRPLVFGAVSRFDGQVTVLVGGEREGERPPCYRCLFPAPPAPGAVPSCAEAGVLGTLPAVIGSYMATEALKLILGLGRPLHGRLMLVDLLEAETTIVAVDRDPACPV